MAEKQSVRNAQNALNVIVPIGGIGSRFAKEGYRFPKPLINIVGRPMILQLIDNLSLKTGDTLWLAINERVDDEFRIGELVSKSFPKIDVRTLRLLHQTRGALETLYVVTRSMNAEQLQRRSVSLDCDTIYFADILQQIRDIPNDYGACFFFEDLGGKPIFSYIKTKLDASSKLPLIVEIAEKKAISNNANTGAYVFPSAHALREWAVVNIDAKSSRPEGYVAGEYYTSQVIATMLAGKVPFIGLPLTNDEFACVGTPEQLQVYLLSARVQKSSASIKKRRFCFDLDSTLVGVPKIAGDYSTCPPIWKNIHLVQQLHKAGHHIIIQTARRMRTHKGNVGAILKDVGITTFAQLDQYDIPYDDIHFGKPWADVYIDDLAVNANMDTAKEIGWLLDEANPPHLLNADAQLTKAPVQGMIAARDFNTIQVVGDKIVKSSKSEAILGELYFYAYMPEDLRSVFPAVYAVDYLSETSTYTVTMENIKGHTFSHLLVGRSITKGRLLTMMKALHQIHITPNKAFHCLPVSADLEAQFAPHSLEKVKGRVNLYANYGHKLRSRYHQYKDKYAALGPLAADLFNRLNEFLDTYEAEDKSVHAQVIHGDPVFSNIILRRDDKGVSFIDVRCQIDDTLTLEGDIHYDLAKVLQSLLGYDHVLFRSANQQKSPSGMINDTPLLDEADRTLLTELQGIFWEYLETKYAVTVHKKTLLRITASLFFSLIPLHKPELGPIFLNLCLSTLDQARDIGHSVRLQSN